jgi:N-acetylmuramoyl-L-alanine amidase
LRRATEDSIRYSVLRRLIFLTLLLAGPARAAELTALSVVPGVVTVSTDAAPAAAFQFALAAPYRLVVDMPAVTIPAAMTADGASSVTRLRAAMFAPGMARLVIDLSRPLEIAAARAGPGGLILELRRVDELAFAASVDKGRQQLQLLGGGPASGVVVVAGEAVSAAGAAPAADSALAVQPRAAVVSRVGVRPDAFELPANMFGSAAASAGNELEVDTADKAVSTVGASSPVRRPAVQSRSGGKPLVVIDAGHGGKDVGSISINGGYEKDVALAIAQATADRLRKIGKVRVKLTRDDDRFIPLGGRATIARLARADLFVSIHADSAPNAMARGASVYTLSAVASDAVAARLAARENKADIIGGINLGVMSPDVGEIMIDLSRRATGNVSVAFADVLQRSLADRILLRGEFHHFAGLVVLKAPDVPSVLFETGYVSNADDAALLFSKTGQRRIADGLADAIVRHLLGD